MLAVSWVGEACGSFKVCQTASQLLAYVFYYTHLNIYMQLVFEDTEQTGIMPKQMKVGERATGFPGT